MSIVVNALCYLITLTFVWRSYMVYFELSWIYSHIKRNWKLILIPSANPSFFIRHPKFGSLKFTGTVWFIVSLFWVTFAV